LPAYTGAAAYASFEENEKGMIAPGKLADFVILDEDLFKAPPARLQHVNVKITVAGGRVVHE
jgi:predicted amidohydrolase YtcJ